MFNGATIDLMQGSGSGRANSLTSLVRLFRGDDSPNRDSLYGLVVVVSQNEARVPETV